MAFCCTFMADMQRSKLEQFCLLNPPAALKRSPLRGLYDSLCLNMCRVVVNTFHAHLRVHFLCQCWTNSAKWVSDNNTHSAVLILTGGEGHQTAKFTSWKQLLLSRGRWRNRYGLLKPRQNTAASPKPELRKTQTRNYRRHNTHTKTEWAGDWQVCVCMCVCVHRRDAKLYSISAAHTCAPVICCEREHTCWVFVILCNLESDCFPTGIENISRYHFHPDLD